MARRLAAWPHIERRWATISAAASSGCMGRLATCCLLERRLQCSAWRFDRPVWSVVIMGQREYSYSAQGLADLPAANEGEADVEREVELVDVVQVLKNLNVKK